MESVDKDIILGHGWPLINCIRKKVEELFVILLDWENELLAINPL